MPSKLSRSSPERYAGKKQSAPSTPKPGETENEVADKSARNASEPEPPVAEKTESHPRSHDSSTEEARSHGSQLKLTHLTEKTDKATKTEVGEERPTGVRSVNVYS